MGKTGSIIPYQFSSYNTSDEKLYKEKSEQKRMYNSG